MKSSPVRELALYQLDASGAAIGGSRAGDFSPARYSGYKYGRAADATWFADRLGALLLERHPELTTDSRVVITASPYRYVPTASKALAEGVREAVNSARLARRLNPAPLAHIERQIVTSGDYARLSAPARDDLMAANQLSVSDLREHTAPDAHLVVVDDIRVTGAHQRCLEAASDEIPLGSRTFLHIAALAPEHAETADPTMEDRLNHAHVRTLEDLAGLAEEPDFGWNVRVCKFLLCAANRAALPGFLAGRSEEFLRELHSNSVGDGYHELAEYRPSHLLVAAELRRRSAVRIRDARLSANSSPN